MHRIVVKGRKVVKHLLVNKGPKKMEFIANANKGNDEEGILYYENND